jgi:arylsulfatase A-like enzyme
MSTLLCTLLLSIFTGAVASPPHILFILVDDLGYAELGADREVNTTEVQTPSIDALVSSGIKLEHHYAHKVWVVGVCR